MKYRPNPTGLSFVDDFHIETIIDSYFFSKRRVRINGKEYEVYRYANPHLDIIAYERQLIREWRLGNEV